MRDCSIQLTNHPGDFARVAQALAAGVRWSAYLLITLVAVSTVFMSIPLFAFRGEVGSLSLASVCNDGGQMLWCIYSCVGQAFKTSTLTTVGGRLTRS